MQLGGSRRKGLAQEAVHAIRRPCMQLGGSRHKGLAQEAVRRVHGAQHGAQHRGIADWAALGRGRWMQLGDYACS